MSGTASVPTQFAAAVTATGQQLDNNFSTVVAYLNDPTNRNNFAVSSGTGTYVVSISPAPGGYTAGLEITFQAGNTNTAAVALNVNGLGVVSALNQDQSAMTASQIIASGVYKAVHNGTNFIFQSPGASIPLAVASQADMETATAVNLVVSPGRQLFHPAMPKISVIFNNVVGTTATITANFGYGITGVNKIGAGTFNVTLSRPFSSTSYGVIGFIDPSTATVMPVLWPITRSTDSLTISIRNPSTGTGGIDNGTGLISFIAYGDLP